MFFPNREGPMLSRTLAPSVASSPTPPKGKIYPLGLQTHEVFGIAYRSAGAEFSTSLYHKSYRVRMQPFERPGAQQGTSGKNPIRIEAHGFLV